MGAEYTQRRVKRMVVLIEMDDGVRTAWAVSGGSMTFSPDPPEVVFDRDPFSTRPFHQRMTGTITAHGIYEGLWLAGDSYRNAGFDQDAIDTNPPELVDRRALPPGVTDAVC